VPTIASAFVRGNDPSNVAFFRSNTGFASVQRVTDGTYELTLADLSFDDDQIVPNVTTRAFDNPLATTAVVKDVVNGVITVLTFVTDTGIVNDMDFYISVDVADL